MHYSNAILRVPAASCANGLTTADLGAPDPQQTRAQFNAYVNILSDLGLTVTVLPADPAFPDGHFVEDTAVVTSEFAIITHPGAVSREGEIATIEPVLARYRQIERIGADTSARMDGGDVLMVEKCFFVGRSARTNTEGIKEFAAIVEKYGYRVDVIDVSAGLHLKSIVNYVGCNTLLLDDAFASHPAFAEFDHLIVKAEEVYAGNTLWINDTLITPEGYPDTFEKLSRLGLNMITTPTSELKKMDGGLTCLSLRL
ncbi:MAG TPA: amidinotransferase [Burkholderiaceae bacterium]|jgi:dimethylargininase|nr:amidinotransferase [Burkholderiaceae bacterium]